VVNATTITATTPAGTAGAKDVSVTTGTGTGTGVGLFTYIDQSNPANDPSVVGLVAAQVELSRQFIEASVLPVMDRMALMRSRAGENSHAAPRLDLNIGNGKASQLFHASPVAMLFDQAAGEVLPKNYGVWVQGTLSRGSVDASEQRSGFDTENYGVTVGIDKRLDTKKLIGTSLFIGRGKADIDDAGSSVEAEALSWSFYGSYCLNASAYLDGLIGYGRQNYDLTRKSGGDILTGERTGDQLFAAIALSKRMETSVPLEITPYIRSDLGYTWLSGYEESGAATALAYEDSEVSLAMISAGVRLERNVEMADIDFRPYARIEYGWEIASSSDADMSYVSSPGNTYRVTIDDDTSSRGRFGLGVDLLVKSGWTIGVAYERQQSDSSDYLNVYRINAAYQPSSSFVYSMQLNSGFENVPALIGAFQYIVNPEISISAGSKMDFNGSLTDSIGFFATIEFKL
jgi:outer membrane autotransporter protein